MYISTHINIYMMLFSLSWTGQVGGVIPTKSACKGADLEACKVRLEKYIKQYCPLKTEPSAAVWIEKYCSSTWTSREYPILCIVKYICTYRNIRPSELCISSYYIMIRRGSVLYHFLYMFHMQYIEEYILPITHPRSLHHVKTQAVSCFGWVY